MSERVLLFVDNSTYFCFKSAIRGYPFDAAVVYNLANFTECLVLADDIVLAPTTAWSPDSSDPLFTKEPICRQFDVSRSSPSFLSATFTSALDACRKDLRSPRLTNSGAVFISDPAARNIFENLGTDVERHSDVARHIAQYLLRTNVALELSGATNGQPTPYHPYSHRARFVATKLMEYRLTSQPLATMILRDAEKLITKDLRGLDTKGLLSRYGAFRNVDTDIPLVLGAALSGSRSPAELVETLLKMRKWPQARACRKWTGRLLTAVYGGTLRKRIEAERELMEARQVLGDELRSAIGLAR